MIGVCILQTALLRDFYFNTAEVHSGSVPIIHDHAKGAHPPLFPPLAAAAAATACQLARL